MRVARVCVSFPCELVCPLLSLCLGFERVGRVLVILRIVLVRRIVTAFVGGVGGGGVRAVRIGFAVAPVDHTLNLFGSAVVRVGIVQMLMPVSRVFDGHHFMVRCVGLGSALFGLQAVCVRVVLILSHFFVVFVGHEFQLVLRRRRAPLVKLLPVCGLLGPHPIPLKVCILLIVLCLCVRRFVKRLLVMHGDSSVVEVFLLCAFPHGAQMFVLIVTVPPRHSIMVLCQMRVVLREMRLSPLVILLGKLLMVLLFGVVRVDMFLLCRMHAGPRGNTARP